MATGHHAALCAEVGPGKTVAVVGDGAVGLCGVLAARRLGAEQIILLGHHPPRVAIGQAFGATDVVRERGDEAVERVQELTNGFGAHRSQCRPEQSMATALRIARVGGAVGASASLKRRRFRRRSARSSTTLPSPGARTRRHRGAVARRSRRKIEPGHVFDRVSPADDARGLPGDEQARALKVLIGSNRDSVAESPRWAPDRFSDSSTSHGCASAGRPV
jgi:threonine dehydrogenase-like Zn-dependent dehydrogenase